MSDKPNIVDLADARKRKAIKKRHDMQEHYNQLRSAGKGYKKNKFWYLLQSLIYCGVIFAGFKVCGHL